ncbi:MAG: hypothetical protein AB7F31_07060, partial [Parachlamydiales bacterium]
MTRIVVVGTSGCGKTTLGKDMALKLGVPHTDLDDLYWLPGWQKRPEEDFEKRLVSVLSGDSWVVTGNFSRYAELIFSRADQILWLDVPLLTCLFRALKRSLQRIRTGELCCNGNRESLGRLLSRDCTASIIIAGRDNYLCRFHGSESAPRYSTCSSFFELDDFSKSL